MATGQSLNTFRGVEETIKRTKRRQLIESLVLTAMGFILIAILYVQFVR